MAKLLAGDLHLQAESPTTEQTASPTAEQTAVGPALAELLERLSRTRTKADESTRRTAQHIPFGEGRRCVVGDRLAGSSAEFRLTVLPGFLPYELSKRTRRR